MTNRIEPQTSHILPQYLCAKAHVSLFFIDIDVRYPNTVLIFVGGLFVKTPQIRS